MGKLCIAYRESDEGDLETGTCTENEEPVHTLITSLEETSEKENDSEIL